MRSEPILRGGYLKAGLWCTAILTLAVLPAAHANIDLVWRPASQTVNVGDTVEIGLYAVSDSAVNQSMIAASVVLQWNPAYLGAVSYVRDPSAWPGSSFQSPDPWHLNDSLSDGDAVYTACRPVLLPAWATPEGLWVASMRFQALAGTPPGSPTQLIIPTHMATTVMDGVTPGLDVHGTLGRATITINPEPATMLILMLAPLLVTRRSR